MRTLHTTFGLIALLAGCADHPYDPNGPAIDPNAPVVHITSPDRGTIAGDVHQVTVTGTATDDTSVASVTVNGAPAALSPDGTWTATLQVVPGTNLIHAIATDGQGNTGQESRAVVAGPMAAISMQVPDAVSATLSAQTFAAIGRGAAGFMTSGDLEALVAPHNPVLDLGGGPDCLYAQASITSLTIGGADVTLQPETGGLWLDAELDQLQIGMHLQYAAACIDGSRDITIGASHVSVSGDMTIGILAGDFDIHLDNPNVQITGFSADLGGIPGEIVSMLSLDTAMGPILGWATEKFVVPMLNNALAGLNNTKTVDVLGTPVDVVIKPSAIDFSDQGGLVQLDTSLRAHGDDGSPGFVYVPNTEPAMDLSHGFQLAVADDAANQLLGSLWAAKGLDKQIDLKTGPYGDVGTLYDSVELEAKVPPYVDATGDGLKLTIGDLMATFKNAGVVTTAIAINAQVDIKVDQASDGSMRFDVGQPTTYVDVLDQGVEGANQLSNAQFEALTSFALSRIIAVGSGSLGAIPLPSVGGVSVTNLSVAEQTGYLVVAGEVQ
jgi:hypothetical protein